MNVALGLELLFMILFLSMKVSVLFHQLYDTLNHGVVGLLRNIYPHLFLQSENVVTDK